MSISPIIELNISEEKRSELNETEEIVVRGHLCGFYGVIYSAEWTEEKRIEQNRKEDKRIARHHLGGVYGVFNS